VARSLTIRVIPLSTSGFVCGMAALADVLGMKDHNAHVLADASVMRIILMVNAIANGPHSTESSKMHPFSLPPLRPIKFAERRIFDAD